MSQGWDFPSMLHTLGWATDHCFKGYAVLAPTQGDFFLCRIYRTSSSHNIWDAGSLWFPRIQGKFLAYSRTKKFEGPSVTENVTEAFLKVREL